MLKSFFNEYVLGLMLGVGLMCLMFIMSTTVTSKIKNDKCISVWAAVYPDTARMVKLQPTCQPDFWRELQ